MTFAASSRRFMRLSSAARARRERRSAGSASRNALSIATTWRVSADSRTATQARCTSSKVRFPSLSRPELGLELGLQGEHVGQQHQLLPRLHRPRIKLDGPPQRGLGRGGTVEVVEQDRPLREAGQGAHPVVVRDLGQGLEGRPRTPSDCSTLDCMIQSSGRLARSRFSNASASW